MLTQDFFRPVTVRGLDPDLGRKALKVAKAGFQVAAKHLTANALLFERLLPNVGLNRVCGCGKANKVVLIFRRYDCHGIP